MDLVSSSKSLEETSDLHKEDCSTFVGKLDLNLAASKEDGEGYGHKKEAWVDGIQVNLNQKEHHGSPSLHVDVKCERLESPYTKSSSPVQTELDHDELGRINCDDNKEGSQSHHGKTEVVSGGFYDKSSSPIKAETFHNEMETGDFAHYSWKSPLTMDSNYQQEDLEDNSLHHDEKLKENSGNFSGNLQYQKTESAYEEMEDGGTELHAGKSLSPVRTRYNGNETKKEDFYYAGKSPSENGKQEGRNSDLHYPRRNPKRSASPMGHMSVSPERSPDIQSSAGQKPPSSPHGVQDSLYSRRSSRHKHSSSPERTGGDSKRVLSQDHLSPSARRTSTSPRRRSRQDYPRRDDSLGKQLSRSPRRHHSSPDHRRQDKSVSRSPTRQRDSSSGYRQKPSSSPGRTGGDSKRVLSQDHLSPSAKRTSTSPWRRSRQDSPRRDDSPGKRLSRSPRRHHSPPDRRRRNKSVSRSPTRQRDSSSGYRQKRSSSLERTGGDSKRVLSQDHLSPSARQTSTSPGKRLSRSPRRHHSPPNRRRQDKSASRSPTRQRDSSSGYRRDYRDRSRSRSPYARDRYIRSPRRRYSPRRRSPPSGYHSHRGSTRRRPWSPPPNRSTGVGRPGNNLFVAGFSFVTTERDLQRKFSRFGRVTDVRIVRDKRSGDSRGFGFLSLERDEDADAAIRALDQTEWNGRVVLVEKSKTPAR